jgi:hypothetical protein
MSSAGADVDDDDDELTTSDISNAIDDLRYAESNARYLLFSQSHDRMMHNIQIVRNQLEVTELMEEMITFITTDIRAMEIYQTIFPQAKIRIFSSTARSITGAVKMIETIIEQIKEIYRKSRNSIYRFIVVDLIDDEKPLQNMTFDNMMKSPILGKLVMFAELCNIGFAMNATLPEMRYLKCLPMQIDHKIINGVNGVVFSPSYSTFVQNQGESSDNHAVHYRISMINDFMYDIYHSMTTDNSVDCTGFESHICDLAQNESIIFTVPEGHILKVGVSSETLDRLSRAQDDILEKETITESETECESELDSESESFIKIDK